MDKLRLKIINEKTPEALEKKVEEFVQGLQNKGIVSERSYTFGPNQYMACIEYMENDPPYLKGKLIDGKNELSIEGFSIKNNLHELEKYLIIKALIQTNGNRTKATKLLECSHKTLLNKIGEYKISIPSQYVPHQKKKNPF